MTYAHEQGPPAPGWYPCPWDSRQLRWWDGRAWSAAVAPNPPAVPPLHDYASPAPDPARDLADELRAATRARWALVGLGVAQIANMFLFGASTHSFFNHLREQIDTASNPNGTTTQVHVHLSGLLLTAQVIGYGALLLQLFVLLWAYRAAEVAGRAGLPARHSPVWAVGGFFVPVINLWFPYQSIVDTLPSTHPHRGIVGWWWTSWLLQLLVFGVVFVVSFLGTAAGLIAAAACTPVPILAVLTGRRMVALIADTHRELLASRSG